MNKYFSILLFLIASNLCIGQDTICITKSKVIQLANEKREQEYIDSMNTKIINEQDSLILKQQIKAIQDSLMLVEAVKIQEIYRLRAIDSFDKLNKYLLQDSQSKVKWYKTKTASYFAGFVTGFVAIWAGSSAINKK